MRKFERPECPFVFPLDPDCFQKIYIKGLVPDGASRFTVYLQNGPDYEPDEIAFVVDFRISRKDVIVNYKTAGDWQLEEEVGGIFPVPQNSYFRIKLVIEDDEFKVKVNGHELLKYERKLPWKSINVLRIDHDVEITQVRLK